MKVAGLRPDGSSGRLKHHRLSRRNLPV